MKNMRVDTATQNKEVHVSKMMKLLVLIAVIALPVIALAEETPAPAAGTPVGDKPYMQGDSILGKVWHDASATFDLKGTEVTIKGFTVMRQVTEDPHGEFYYKENNTYWTWKEGYVVTAPAMGKDLGYFTYRPPTAPKTPDMPKGKIYKATPPATPAPTPTAPKTGWKKGEESVRSK